MSLGSLRTLGVTSKEIHTESLYTNSFPEMSYDAERKGQEFL